MAVYQNVFVNFEVDRIAGNRCLARDFFRGHEVERRAFGEQDRSLLGYTDNGAKEKCETDRSANQNQLHCLVERQREII